MIKRLTLARPLPPVTLEQLTNAVREVRMEADRLRMACIAAAKSRAFLHIAFDRTVAESLNPQEALLLKQLDAIQ